MQSAVPLSVLLHCIFFIQVHIHLLWRGVEELHIRRISKIVLLQAMHRMTLWTLHLLVPLPGFLYLCARNDSWEV